MKIYILKTNLLRLCYIAVMTTGLANLAYASRFLLPLGDDGIIVTWPAGYWVNHVPWYQIPKVLVASFIGEDHLFPMLHLLGSIIQNLPLRPEVAVNISDKVLFLGVIMGTFAVAISLWNSYSKALLFLAFVIPNTAMTWRIMVSNAGFNLSACTVFTALFFYLQHLKQPRAWSALVFSAAFVIMTFSHEAAFIGLPLFAIFTLFQAQLSPINKKLRLLVVNGCWLMTLFLPYLIIHYLLYGAILPQSRLGVLAQGNPIGLVLRGVFSTWSEWLFDIPKVMLRGGFGKLRWETEMATNLVWPVFFSRTFGLLAAVVAISAVALILRYAIRNRFISWSGKLLWLALAVQNLLMLWTGRFEDGMWIIAGLTFWLAVTDLVFNLLTKGGQIITVEMERKVSIASFGVLGTGILLGFIVQPFDQAQRRYLNPYRSTMAAYRAIGQDTGQFTLVRLQPSTEFFHQAIFWVGHNIFWGHPGLWYDDQHSILYVRNMAMQTYTTSSPNAFREILVHNKRTRQNHEVLLFEDQNLFFRLFLDSANSQILRIVPIPGSNPQTFAIRLPYEQPDSGTTKHLRFELTFDRPLVGAQRLSYAGRLIEDSVSIDQNKLLFLSANLNGGDLQISASNAQLTQVDVFEILASNNGPPSTSGKHNAIIISSPTALCVFGLVSATGVQFSGSLDAGTLLAFSPLLPGKFGGSYSSVAPNRSLRKTGTINFDPSINSDPIIVCP